MKDLHIKLDKLFIKRDSGDYLYTYWHGKQLFFWFEKLPLFYYIIQDVFVNKRVIKCHCGFIVGAKDLHIQD